MGARDNHEIVLTTYQGDDFLRELGPNHPFGRICCKGRTTISTVCDGTCGGCKKEMEKFKQNEPIRMKASDIVFNGGDNEGELPDLSIYRINLENRIKGWQQKKQEIIATRQAEDEFNKKVEARMSTLRKQLLTPEIPSTVQ